MDRFDVMFILSVMVVGVVMWAAISALEQIRDELRKMNERNK